MASLPKFKLHDGQHMPTVGIGCWIGKAGEADEVTNMVATALRLGYRHIDTASNYGNERSVGEGIRKSSVPRNEIFLTTKLDQADHERPADALDRSLEKLGVDYVDLFLMHWPQAFTTEGKVLTPDESPTFVETWSVMEKLVESGKTKSIGVSNFSVKTLEILLRHAKLIPVANQVELHPCLPQHALLKYCISRGILLTAYSPLGKYKIASDPDIVAIADRMTIEYGEVSPAQVMLSWGVQRGTAVIPRTLHEERMKQNMRLLTLSDEDMHVLDGLHLKPGMHRSVCGFHSSDLGGSCFGWTYDMLGWDMVEGGIMRDLTD